MAPSECASGSFRVYQYGSFRMYQYSSFRMYVDCHVTKSKVQAGAVTEEEYQCRYIYAQVIAQPFVLTLKDT
jgi:hypothetical protein